MALVLADRVLETTTTTGSGTITLAGAKQGYQTFSLAIGDGNQTYYTIAGTTEWEVGVGIYTSSGNTLSRDTVLSSSDSGNKVTFSAGTKDVFVTYPAETSVVNETASPPANGQLLIGNGTGFALSTLTAGSGMTITNNAGSITLSAGGLPPVTVSNTTTISAAAGNHYVLTAASLTTVTLPASPTISDTIYVTVANGLTTNVVARNGKNIQGIAEDLTLNATYASVQLRFTDNTEGWIFA